MHVAAIGPFGFKDFPEADVFSLVRDNGIDRVHVVRDFENKYPAETISAMLGDAGIVADSYHSEHGEHIDLASDDGVKRQQSLDTIESEAAFALQLHAEKMVIHPCGVTGDTGADLVSCFQRSLDQLARMTERLPITLLIENMPPGFRFGTEAGMLAEMVATMHRRRLGICFDTGHANMTGTAVAEHVASTSGFIHYIHAHDNDGKEDQHLLPFSGTIDWSAVSAALKAGNFTGTICLEVFEPVSVLREKFSALWWQRFNTLTNGRAQ